MASTSSKVPKSKPLHIVFLHLDLGIGGAEQLIINLALASLPSTDNDNDNENENENSPCNNPSENSNDKKHCLLNSRVSIFTTHCNQSHCFDAVRKDPTNMNSGKLADCVHVVGSFLPVNVCEYGTALCSTVRMLYLSLAARWMYPDADVFVLDVLPTPIPYLIFGTGGGVKSVIFYCHFPDKLLTRNTVNGIPTHNGFSTNTTPTTQTFTFTFKPCLQFIYRTFLDRLEEWSMSFSDIILLNSNFTKQEVLTTFPTLAQQNQSHTHTVNTQNTTHKSHQQDGHMQVLYPAIDLKGFIPPNFAHKQRSIQNHKNTAKHIADDNTIHSSSMTSTNPIVSLNRFERKKNIEILLRAYAKLNALIQTSNTTPPASISNDIAETRPMDYLLPPPLIIAGGYDPNNRENKEYLTELKNIAKSLDIEKFTSFRPSISDDERASLLQPALCVVYTPYREHFNTPQLISSLNYRFL